jgi:hypothetical protein
VPVRALSILLGRGLVFLLRLPFQILGLGLRLAGYLFVAALLLIVLFLVFGAVGGPPTMVFR